MKKLLSILAMGVALAVPGAAHADGYASQQPANAAQGRVIEWTVGVQYWNSTGRMAKDLYSNVNPAFLVSRLTYADTQAHSGDLYLRGDHRPTGLFVKGFIGGGSITGGHMNDEDFALVAVPTYSNTLQETHNGSLKYATVDFGWTFYDSMRGPSRGSIKDGGYEGLRSTCLSA